MSEKCPDASAVKKMFTGRSGKRRRRRDRPRKSRVDDPDGDLHKLGVRG